MKTDSIDSDQSDRVAASRPFNKLPTVLGCILLAVLAWKLSSMASPEQAERREAQAEIAQCRDDQERMFLTPERARNHGSKCERMEAEYRRRFE